MGVSTDPSTYDPASGDPESYDPSTDGPLSPTVDPASYQSSTYDPTDGETDDAADVPSASDGAPIVAGATQIDTAPLPLAAPTPAGDGVVYVNCAPTDALIDLTAPLSAASVVYRVTFAYVLGHALMHDALDFFALDFSAQSEIHDLFQNIAPATSNALIPLPPEPADFTTAIAGVPLNDASVTIDMHAMSIPPLTVADIKRLVDPKTRLTVVRVERLSSAASSSPQRDAQRAQTSKVVDAQSKPPNPFTSILEYLLGGVAVLAVLVLLYLFRGSRRG